jgi:ElaB/YqjD/DUF883 family membrane-anchored ribosome-binding protein
MEISDQTKAQYKQLKEDIDILKEQVATLTSSASTDAKNAATSMLERTEDKIRQNPIPSTIIAAWAGLLFGLIISK